MHAATLNKVDKTPLVIDETVVTFAKVVSSGAWCIMCYPSAEFVYSSSQRKVAVSQQPRMFVSSRLVPIMLEILSIILFFYAQVITYYSLDTCLLFFFT